MMQKVHKCKALRCERIIILAHEMCGLHWSMVPTYLQILILKNRKALVSPDRRLKVNLGLSKDPQREYIKSLREAITSVARSEGIDNPS